MSSGFSWFAAGDWPKEAVDGVDVWVFAPDNYGYEPFWGRMVLNEDAEPHILVLGNVVSLCVACLDGWHLRVRSSGEASPPLPCDVSSPEPDSASELVDKLTAERNALEGKARDADDRIEKMRAQFAKIRELVSQADSDFGFE